MNERKKKILKISVKEHIKTAKPVASDVLYSKYKLGISPATIRHEFFDLEEEGYLFQPHTSSGRVPLDKGYRFFIDDILDNFSMEDTLNQEIERWRRNVRDYDFLDSISEILSEETGVLGLAGSLNSGKIARSGMKQLFLQPDFYSNEDFMEMGDTIERMEKQFLEFVDDLFNDGKEDFRVFIGNENPFGMAEKFTFMVSSFKHKKDRSAMIIMGPKRMHYRRNLQAIKELQKAINEF